MLAREQRRRHHDGNLQTVQRGNERSAHRDFCFAEADVAADQAVHRLARAEIIDDRINAGGLIFRFFIGEARDEFVERARGRRPGPALRAARAAPQF